MRAPVGAATARQRKVTVEMAATAERKKSRHLRVFISHAAQSAVRTLDLECEGLQALRATLDQQLKEPFRLAVATLAAARGRVIVTGIGKSEIGRAHV